MTANTKPTRAEKCGVIAEACGWHMGTFDDGEDCAPVTPEGDYALSFPAYFTDRNACDEALRSVEEMGLVAQFTDRLWRVINHHDGWILWAGVTAPIEAIAEALYQTFKEVRR